MERHPDLAEMRMRYERAAQTPRAQVVDGLTFLVGLYLAMSPWVVGFNTATALTASNLICGIAVALLAVGFASAFDRTHGIAWVAPVIGLWVIVSPWLVSGAAATTAAITNNVLTGILCLIFGLGAMAVAGMPAMPTRGRVARNTRA